MTTKSQKKVKPPRFKQHKAGHGGWSEWVYPTPKSYLFKCCDCGLVHEIQFKTFLEKTIPMRRGTSGRFEVIELPQSVRAMFRARRYRTLKAPSKRKKI